MEPKLLETIPCVEAGDRVVFKFPWWPYEVGVYRDSISSAEAGDLQAPALCWTYKFESADSLSAENANNALLRHQLSPELQEHRRRQGLGENVHLLFIRRDPLEQYLPLLHRGQLQLVLATLELNH
jgi:hypothetical protein